MRAIELSLLDVGDLVSERRRGQTEWWLILPDEKTKGQRGGRSLPLAPDLMATLLAYLRATGRTWDSPEHRETPLFLALSRGRAPSADPAGVRWVAIAHEQAEREYRRLRPEQIRGVIHRVEAPEWQAQRHAVKDDDALATTGSGRRISPHALRHSAAIALLLGDEASERPPASVEHVRGWLGHFDIRTTQRYLSHIESRDQRRRFAIRPQTRTPPASSEPALALRSISPRSLMANSLSHMFVVTHTEGKPKQSAHPLSRRPPRSLRVREGTQTAHRTRGVRLRRKSYAEILDTSLSALSP